MNEAAPGTDRVPVGLLGIGVSTPPSVPQEVAAVLAEELLGDGEVGRARLRRIFSRSGVRSRGSVLHDDSREFYPPPATGSDRGPGTRSRMDRYAVEAPGWAADAAAAALRDADLPAERVTCLITVSCTGFFAPGLDVELIRRLSLRPDVRRLHVGFMGCHAAFNAIGVARSIVQADARARVLICCVELCSLHFAYGPAPDRIVANSLFSDGAAAAVMGRVNRADARWEVLDTASLLVPDSADAMTWRIGDSGFEMTLSPGLPERIRVNLRPWCERWLGACELSIDDIRHWAVHPGGPKILDAAAAALELSDEDLRHSRSVLAEHGNMSSATVLFILRRMLREDARGTCAAIGFGPGLMMEGMLLRRE